MTNRIEQYDSEDVHLMLLVKGEDRYVFAYTETNAPEVLRTLGRFAADPDLSLSWLDASRLGQRVKKLNAKAD